MTTYHRACALADLPTIVRWCESALGEARDDHRRTAEILAFMSWMRLLEGRVRDALAHARAALEEAKLAEDDDSGGGLNARILFTAQRDGMYRIIATSLYPALGRYTVTVQELEQASKDKK